ncbi:MAG: hypothetical protein RIR00_518 [Pseudomonadota bacterium]|jgi:HlyD family secretion protein
MSKSIFREAALERLSTPEQLDRLVRLTRPLGQWALAGVLVVFLIGLVWSTLVALPIRVPAQGMLLAEDGLLEVMSASRGRVSALLVRPGDTVRVGQVVAQIEQAETSQELQLARLELAELRDKHAALSSLSGSEARSRQKADEDRREGIRQAMGYKQERIRWLEEKLAQDKELMASGFTSKQRMVTSQIELNTARSELAGLDNELKQLEAQHGSQAVERKRTLMDTELKQNAAARRVRELEEKLARQGVVRSPYAGQVAELKVNRGEMLDSGAALFSLQAEEARPGQLLAVIYVAPEEGKRIAPGMAVQVSPSTVKREEYGFIVGRVSRVAAVPATQEGMLRVLKNRPLAEKLAGGGAPFEVWVELEQDPDNPSGYRWSSFNPLLMRDRPSRAPALSLSGNTLAAAQITVREKRLITLLLPGLESWFEAP